MKHFKTSLVILLILSITSLTFRATAQDKAVESMHQLYTTMINTGNPTNLDALYAQDATIRNSDGSMVMGLENIKGQYKNTFSSGKFNIVLKTNEVTTLGKDHMFVSGSFVYNKINEPKMGLVGEFVNTLKNEKGTWKIQKSYRYLTNKNNTAVVNGLYKAFAVGDIPSALGAMDAKIVWNEAESNSLADGNPYIGPDAVLNGVFARLGAEHEYFKLEDIQLHGMDNNQVLATLRYDAKVKKTGKAYNAQVAHLWTLKDGKIIAFQQYADTKKLAEAE